MTHETLAEIMKEVEDMSEQELREILARIRQHKQQEKNKTQTTTHIAHSADPQDWLFLCSI
jgi:predicted Fe-S protein YdhL (DUF1289 family)